VFHNVDEIGFDSLVDPTRKSVILPADYEGTQIVIPIARNDGYTTIVTCIAANNQSLKSFIVIPRQLVEAELLDAESHRTITPSIASQIVS
jgi:hypothetical protein